MKVLRGTNLNHRQLTSSSAEMFSRSAVLSESLGMSRVFIHHDLLEPGRRLSGQHRHSLNEEMFYVLRGSPTVCYGTERVRLAPGDMVAFPPGDVVTHSLLNETNETVEILGIGSNLSEDEVVYE